MDQVVRLTHFLDKHLLYRFLKSLPSEYAQLKLKYLASTCLVEEYDRTYVSVYSQQPPKECLSVYSKHTEYIGVIKILDDQLKFYLNSEQPLDKNVEVFVRMYVNLNYECGNYEISYKILKMLRESGFADPWFELITSILVNSPDLALFWEIEKSVTDYKQKACLLHLALFIGFPNDPGFFLDLALKNKYSLTIQNTCPSLIRYIQASILLLNRTYILPGILTLLETAHKHDQTFNFIITLMREFDYERAMLQIRSLQKPLSSDYFLQGLMTQIQERSEEYILLIYYKIHQKVPKSLLDQAHYIPNSSAEERIYSLAEENLL
jgi:hypothetical protein